MGDSGNSCNVPVHRCGGFHLKGEQNQRFSCYVILEHLVETECNAEKSASCSSEPGLQ